MSPLFTHDCDACEFVGPYQGKDIYFCGSGLETTLIVRHSSDGPDYEAGSRVLINGYWLSLDDIHVLQQIVQGTGSPGARSRLSGLAQLSREGATFSL